MRKELKKMMLNWMTVLAFYTLSLEKCVHCRLPGTTFFLDSLSPPCTEYDNAKRCTISFVFSFNVEAVN